MTNREKFKEVFGFKPSVDAECIMPTSVCFIHDKICMSSQEGDCPFFDWWDKEYKPCFQLKPELEDDDG